MFLCHLSLDRHLNGIVLGGLMCSLCNCLSYLIRLNPIWCCRVVLFNLISPPPSNAFRGIIPIIPHCCRIYSGIVPLPRCTILACSLGHSLNVNLPPFSFAKLMSIVPWVAYNGYTVLYNPFLEIPNTPVAGVA